LKSWNLALHKSDFLGEDLQEGLIPLKFNDIDPKPVIWELIPLRVQKLLPSLLSLELLFPSLNIPLDFLDLCDEDGHIV
jgi:hypothetical protein